MTQKKTYNLELGPKISALKAGEELFYIPDECAKVRVLVNYYNKKNAGLKLKTKRVNRFLKKVIATQNK